MKRLKRFIRNTRAFAYAQGLWERSTNRDDMERTYPTGSGWNRSYDNGWNRGNKLLGWRA